MSITKKEYGFLVGSHWVEVVGKTAAIHPQWGLVVDGAPADTVNQSGKFSLSTEIDGKTLTAHIDQGLFGPVEIIVHLGDQKVFQATGFLA